MIPAAGPAYLDDMHRELLASLGEAHQLLGCASRSSHRPEAVAVDPGYEGELFFPADRARDLAPPTVELRRTQQIGICITYLGDIDPARIDVSQQRPAPERVVDYLPLNSHANQSSGVRARTPRSARLTSPAPSVGSRPGALRFPGRPAPFKVSGGEDASLRSAYLARTRRRFATRGAPLPGSTCTYQHVAERRRLAPLDLSSPCVAQIRDIYCTSRFASLGMCCSCSGSGQGDPFRCCPGVLPRPETPSVRDRGAPYFRGDVHVSMTCASPIRSVSREPFSVGMFCLRFVCVHR